jgi:hypothetical protein
VLLQQDLHDYGRHRLSASKAGLPETGFIRHALMGKQWMDMDNLTKMWSRSHFACWQLNRSVYQQASPGLQLCTGLRTSHTFERHTMYDNAWRMQAGLLVSIHNEADPFFDEDAAFLVAAGTRHDVKIIRTSAKRLQYPYGTACVEGADSVSRCIQHCQQMLIAQNECSAPDDLVTAEKIATGVLPCVSSTLRHRAIACLIPRWNRSPTEKCAFPPEQYGASDVAAQRMRFRAPLYAFCPLPGAEDTYDVVEWLEFVLACVTNSMRTCHR